MKTKILKGFLVVVTIITTMLVSNPTYTSAAGFSLSASATQVAPGQSFTVYVNGDVAGRFDATVSNGSLNANSIFIDNAGSGGSFTITASAAGSTYVTVTAIDATDSSYNAVTGAQGVSVSVVAPATNNSTISSQTTTNQATESEIMPISEVEEDEETIETTTEEAKEGAREITGESETIKTALFGDVKIATSLDSADILTGFEKVDLKVKNKENKTVSVQAYQNTEGKAYVIYGTATVNKKEITSFFIYDEKTKTIASTFRQEALLGSQYGVVEELNTFENCKALFGNPSQIKEGTVTIDNINYKGFVYTDKELSTYALIYLMNDKGEYGLYQFESVSRTLQPYASALQSSTLDFNHLDTLITNYEDHLVTWAAIGCADIFLLLFIVMLISFIVSKKRQKRGPKQPKQPKNKKKKEKVVETPTEENPVVEETKVLDTNELRLAQKELSKENLPTTEETVEEPVYEDVVEDATLSQPKSLTPISEEVTGPNNKTTIDDIINSLGSDLQTKQEAPVMETTAEEKEPHAETLEMLTARFEEAEKQYFNRDYEDKKPSDYNLNYADKIEAMGFLARRRKKREKKETRSPQYKFSLEEYKNGFLSVSEPDFLSKNEEILKTVFTVEDEEIRNKNVEEFIARNKKIVFYVANKIRTSFSQYPINKLIEVGMRGYNEVLEGLNEDTADTFLGDTIMNVSKSIICYIYNQQEIEKSSRDDSAI